MEIAAILLCGGQSRRFGGDKLLAGADPLAARAARPLVGVADRTLAVIPLGRERLRAVLESAGCEVLETDRTMAGMGASLAAGVEATTRADGWIVALGDMPAIRARTVRDVRGALERGARIAAPFDATGRRGHPVGFAAEWRAALAALHGDEGARELLARHPGAIERVASDDPGIHIDVDTPDDFRQLDLQGEKP